MIHFFKSWCEGIIVAIVLSIIIESMVPEGNYKKYIKVVIGLYIVFTIFNPFLGKLSNADFQLHPDWNLETFEASSSSAEDIREVYASGIEQMLKENVEEEFGVIIQDLQIMYDEKYENIEQIILDVGENNAAGEIEKVEIGGPAKEKSPQDYPELKQYIAENYGVDLAQIIIR